MRGRERHDGLNDAPFQSGRSVAGDDASHRVAEEDDLPWALVFGKVRVGRVEDEVGAVGDVGRLGEES